MKVEVINGPVPFGTKYYRNGEQFTVADQRFASLLVKVGRVKEVKDEPPRRRVYRRRDMKAEEATVMTAAVVTGDDAA